MTSFKQSSVTLMLHLLFALTLFAVTSVQVGASIPAGSLAPSEPMDEADMLANYGNLPLYFERNLGQTDAQAHYLAKTSGYTFFLTPERMAFNLAVDAPQAPDSEEDVLTDVFAEDTNADITETATSRQYGLYVDFVGANPSPQIRLIRTLCDENRVSYTR